MKKLIPLEISSLLLILLLIIPVSCDKDEDIVPPPEMGILTEDPSGTLGELNLRLYYMHGYNNDISSAPTKTEVYLYGSIDAYNAGIPIFSTYTYQDNEIYFGFLDPSKDYYIYTYLEHNGVEYDVAAQLVLYEGVYSDYAVTLTEIYK